MGYVSELRTAVGRRPLLIPGGRAVLRNDRGEILFHRRSDLGIWDLPGGAAEVGESAEACVIREVHEETGLTVLDYVPIGFGLDPVKELVVYPNGDVVQCFSLVLSVTEWSGDLVVSDESTEFCFIALDDLPPLRRTWQRRSSASSGSRQRDSSNSSERLPTSVGVRRKSCVPAATDHSQCGRRLGCEPVTFGL